MSRFLLRAARPVALRAAAVVVLAGAAAAGCSSSGDGSTALPSGPALTTTAAPTTAAPTTPSPTPEASVGTRRSPIRWLGPAAGGARAQVQEATRSYWSMVVRLAEKPDPGDPQIAALSVDPQAGQLITLYTNIKAQGISQRGPIDGSVAVGSVGASAATATTCLDQTLTLVYDKAGAPRPGSRGTKAQFSVSLQRTGGVWKVSQVNSNGADCTLPR